MKEEDTTPKEVQGPTILLDNNVLQSFLKKELRKAMEPILQELASSDATLAVSQIVVYESLKAIIYNEKRFAELNEFYTKYIMRYPIDEDVLVDAARLHELYGMDPKLRNHRAAISTEDIIIAVTAIRQGAYVLTCDFDDFPAPFFKEVGRQIITYTVKAKQHSIILYALQPDRPSIDAQIEEIMQTANK